MNETHLTRRQFISTTLAAGFCAFAYAPGALAGGPAKVRIGTLAPRGSSYYKHLQTMGEQWRTAPGGGVALTIYPDGTMGSEADMVRRMRLGQLQAGMLTAVGLAEIEPAVNGLQTLPMMFRNLDEVDYIGDKLQPLLEKRMEEKGFVALFWSDTGWVRFFSKQPVITPDDLKKTKLFVWAGGSAESDIYRSVGCNPVSLETVDILPSLQTGLINAVPMPPTYALAGQVDSAAPNMLDLAWGPLVGALVLTKKTWDALAPETQASLRKSAIETGKLIKQDGRRESEESIEAMRKRGLKVNRPNPEVEAQWRREVEAIYPKIRGRLVPEDIFDLVVEQLKTYRSTGEGQKR
jgi:TRAP-type C4-dicarboxylate transport system substrate-binding protein